MVDYRSSTAELPPKRTTSEEMAIHQKLNKIKKRVQAAHERKL